jgi:GNAT superfamily N-acetyltransferase
MHIREAQIYEYEVLGELTFNAYKPLFADTSLPEDLGWYGAELRDVKARSANSKILVAEIKGELVGVVSYCDDYSSQTDASLEKGTAGFRVLATMPSVQGRGVGRSLVEWCIREARNTGKASIVLNTTEYMQAAQRLYRKLGFVEYPNISFEIGGKSPVKVLGFQLSFERQGESS